MIVDVNSDMGEGFGAFSVADDHTLIHRVSSCSLACMFHGGDPVIMSTLTKQARALGVGVGAHISLPDILGFGRRRMAVKPDDLYCYGLYQIGALREFCQEAGISLQHVKPHGALYAMMLEDRAVGETIVRICKTASLTLFCPSGSWIAESARHHGVSVAAEILLDREYDEKGQYRSGHVITDPALIRARARLLVSEGRLPEMPSGGQQLHFHTLCVHGDNPRAVEILDAVREELTALDVSIRPIAQVLPAV